MLSKNAEAIKSKLLAVVLSREKNWMEAGRREGTFTFHSIHFNKSITISFEELN